MRSAQPADDRTARARIRDVALHRFGEHGVDRTTVREIAADAGVSPALVLHHFGSKHGLREACDAFVVDLVAQKAEWTRQGAPDSPMPSPLAGMMAQPDPVLRYLTRALVEDSPAAAALFDDMLAQTEQTLAAGEDNGLLLAGDDRRARAAVLLVWQLGALVLSPHLSRAIDGDALAWPAMGRWTRAALELFTDGLFTDDRWFKAFADQDPLASAGGDTTQAPPTTD